MNKISSHEETKARSVREDAQIERIRSVLEFTEVVIQNDTVFCARIKSSLSSYPAKDRLDAFHLALSIDNNIRWHREDAVRAFVASCESPK